MTEQQIPKGYKATEVGVIPDDWELIAVCDLVRNIIDYRGRTPKKLGMNWGGGNIVALSANNVKNGYIDFNVESYLASDDLYRRWMSNGDAQKNDLVFTMEAPLGNVALIPDDNKYILSQRTILLQIKKDRYEPSYIYQLFLSTSFQQYLQISATGSTAQGIKRSRFENLLLIVPPTKKEQTAIANALSDTDALINQLKKLITKKQAIKTATMQQLLTGKTRLPEFAYRADGSLKGTKISESGEIPEDWDILNLEKIIDCLDNLRIPLNESERLKMYGDIPYCGANGIVGWVNDFLIDDNIILIAEDGGYFDEYSYRPIAYQVSGKCWVNNHAHVLKAKSLFNQEFIFYTLVHKDIQRYLSSGTRAKLNKSEMFKIEINMPSLKKEQTAIASILTEMDQEITLLETRLAKTEHIKQGMMQQLLTGKIRLI